MTKDQIIEKAAEKLIEKPHRFSYPQNISYEEGLETGFKEGIHLSLSTPELYREVLVEYEQWLKTGGQLEAFIQHKSKKG